MTGPTWNTFKLYKNKKKNVEETWQEKLATRPNKNN